MRKRPLVIGGIAALVVIGGIAVFGVARGRASARADWEALQASGVLRVGLDASYPPFETLGANNEIVGFDVDLAREIGRRLDMEVQLVNIVYDGLYDALLTGRVDVLISALVADPAYSGGRATFTTPYFNIGEHLVVQDGSPIATVDDLSGRTLAVEYGSGGDVEARKLERRLADLTVLRADDAASAVAMVEAGEADAALVDGVSAYLGVGGSDSLIIADNVVDTLLSVAVHPEKPRIHGEVDAAVQAIIADGTLGALIDTWFGPQH